MTHAHPNYVYQLVDDPDRENGLLVPGCTLRMNYAEVNCNLKARVFTPGSIIRHLRQGRDYRVVMVGGDQTLSVMGG